MAGPKIAYILLWFPEPSQTFILAEVNSLIRLGLEVEVYSLYGPRPAARVAGMARVTAPVRHLGLIYLGSLLRELWRSCLTQGKEVQRFLTGVLFRRWRSLETAGEAIWATLSGVHLARRFLRDGVHHIHAPWADGPATAAWVASHLSGIPFSFSARARDIYPPDGSLVEKMQHCVFVRTNNKANVQYLQSQAPHLAEKVQMVYNGLTLDGSNLAEVPMQPPCRVLALGRFVRTKGFDVLIRACRILADEGLDFRLTLAGSGSLSFWFKHLTHKLRLQEKITFPGFISHDRLPSLLCSHDLFVVPSVVKPNGDQDGIPNVIMEALSHRLPVVATDVCGIPEVIHHGRTGLLSPQRDPVALARAIVTMTQDRRGALEMAERGRSLVLRMFDPEANAAKLKQLFTGQIARALVGRPSLASMPAGLHEVN
jgi:glycosyltransferase involved in cell wall biosynthesis